MTKIRDVFEYLNAWAPVESCESWDNVGLLVGRFDATVSKILVALDITKGVMEEAAAIGAELIVAHHPVIFSPITSVTEYNADAVRALYLAENKIAAICMHTNLDFAPDGVDQTLPEVLGFGDSLPLSEEGGRISELAESVSLVELLPRIKKSLNTSGLRYYDSGRPIKRIATVCGSGGGYLSYCVQNGCDTLITGDIKHDVFVEAEVFGINLVDAGHFSTENLIVPVIVEKLEEAFPELDVAASSALNELARYHV
ncbi:MAG: Nif3-like dinuclear metal center hexameric protein [Ruminococcaceae bacterium]|nr:Nif3-like dinuclear metal center hexameric protein [Oscillospiraceae bacterium]